MTDGFEVLRRETPSGQANAFQIDVYSKLRFTVERRRGDILHTSVHLPNGYTYQDMNMHGSI
jgi:hypothetical protein